MVCYAAATVLYGYYFVDKRHQLSIYATVATGVGFVTHTVSIGLRWYETGSFPFQGPFESLTIAAWALVLIYFIVEHFSNIKVMGIVLVPVALVLLVIANLTFRAPGGEVAEVLDSWRVGIHVVLIMLANAGFAIGGVASLLYIVQESQLKSHRTNVLFRRLPSLATTDRLARKAIAWAFPAYTAGILLGTVRAAEFDVEGWYLDPRVLLAFVVWFAFGSYLVLRSRQRIAGRAAAFLAIAGMSVAIVLGVVARTLPEGFHIFGT